MDKFLRNWLFAKYSWLLIKIIADFEYSYARYLHKYWEHFFIITYRKIHHAND